MRRPLTVLAVAAALTGTLSACGGDDNEFSDVVPKTTPGLVAPEDSGLPAERPSTTETSTTTTSTTETTPDSTGAAGSGSATPAPVTPQQSTPQQSAPQSGGTATPGTEQQQQQGGGSGGTSGGFSDFCAQNPGACPDE